MKTGRNDPCPCGSGKKYKKCCLAKDEAVVARGPVTVPPPKQSAVEPGLFLGNIQHAKPLMPTAISRPHAETPPPEPPDPIVEKEESRWRQFESRDEEGRIAVFLETLEDDELMSDDLAFEMLNRLRADAVARGEPLRFGECVEALRQRQPEVFDEGAHYYLSWRLVDALADNRLEEVTALARELAPRTGGDIDIVSRTLDALAYHGQLSILVEFYRTAWPGVKSSSGILAWAISRFAEEGAKYEIFDYLERTAAPDMADAGLLDRIKFFVEEPREVYLGELIRDLSGKSGRQWKTDDFLLKPPRRRSRDDWDDEDEKAIPPDQGATNLVQLINEFVGYMRHEEGVPFPRGELVRHELFRYFLRRNEGDLDPRPSMMEQALNPKLKLPKPPPPVHPLCPERVTFDTCLGGLMGMMSGQYHTAAALFQVMPAWLRFLESRQLIDAGTREKVVQELLPLHGELVRLWEKYTDDPTLYREGLMWLANAAKGPDEARK